MLGHLATWSGFEDRDNKSFVNACEDLSDLKLGLVDFFTKNGVLMRKFWQAHHAVFLVSSQAATLERIEMHLAAADTAFNLLHHQQVGVLLDFLVALRTSIGELNECTEKLLDKALQFQKSIKRTGESKETSTFPLFPFIGARILDGTTSWNEKYRVENMPARFVVYPPDDAKFCSVCSRPVSAKEAEVSIAATLRTTLDSVIATLQASSTTAAKLANAPLEGEALQVIIYLWICRLFERFS